ncbi:hypothetical protein APHAL10511_002469 [Amanita phalloides]|nr:hypothetical protein APHAL10511_002469 [Amanita phalloides]
MCRIAVRQSDWERHIGGPKHQKREKYISFKAALDEVEKDKNGLMTEGDFDFGIVEPNIAACGTRRAAKIRLTTPSTRIAMISHRLVSSINGKDDVDLMFEVTVEGASRNITTITPITVQVTFRQKHIGRYQDRVEMLFEDVQLNKRFIISKPLYAIVGSKADHETLKPMTPYTVRPRTTREPELKVVEGVPPPSTRAVPYIGKLPLALIPSHLLAALSSGTTGDIIRRVRRTYLAREFNSETYARFFKYLLWIEEYRSERDLERYDMTNVTLAPHRPYYYLEVPGLAEKRPSVLIGDRILVQRTDATKGHWFSGAVHVVRQREVGLRFRESFSGWRLGQTYNVRFKLNRLVLQRQHMAMDTAFSQDRVLFPERGHIQSPRLTNSQIKAFNPLIQKNAVQLRAVTTIVNSPPGSIPFIIFGPPGTGKTITIVEAIRQILTYPNARVLACAPSNSAADIIVSRLSVALNPDELFRFYAPSRSKEHVSVDILRYSCVKDNGSFGTPVIGRMRRFRVVITTCVSASVVSGIGLPRGHYSHIFIDEAGQATEPEAFVAIKTMADNLTNVILSGDPKQLGPIIRSTVARVLGLEKSYLMRLMERDVYEVKKGHVVNIVKLVQNFRSHGAILKFPNERFYGGDLEKCADASVTDAYVSSSLLPAKEFPVIFHAVAGRDERESHSPSFFNIDEAIQVKAYVQALRGDRRTRSTENDIGIITPYNAQCLKIRAVLRGVADEIKVGSVEEFQGQERQVIIISTVRSSREFVEYDLRHTLGFVASPRRFNVAITRAKSLLIIVGDPHVLSLDPLWRSFLNYIYNQGGWVGCGPSWDTQERVDEQGGYDKKMQTKGEVDMREYSLRIEGLTVSGMDGEDHDANVDRPWREAE